VEESIVDDLDSMVTDVLGKILNLLLVDPSGPVEFWASPAGPKIAYRAVRRNLLKELSGGPQQVQRRFEDSSVQAFEQVEQLAFAATTVHGR
jgi:hypothetical protein